VASTDLASVTIRTTAQMAGTKLIRVALAGVALVAVAWSALAALGSARPAGKSGGRAAIRLELAVTEARGTPAAQVAETFARRIESRSNGSIRVTVRYRPGSSPTAASTAQVEARAISAVRTNAVQLAVLPSYVFREHGVATLRALQAPFLITSSSLAQRVTTGPLADRLQAGLGRLSLTGLGLVPEGLERPFGYLKPLIAPADFGGATIRSDGSRDTRAVLRTLGARPLGPDTREGDTALRSGFDSSSGSLPAAGSTLPRDSFTAAEVAVFPKVDVLVASRAALAALPPSSRSILERAGADTRTETIAATDEPAAAAAFCRAGGTVVSAPPSALRRLRARTAPVLASMRRDPVTRALISEIERVRARDGVAVEPCDPLLVETAAEPRNADYPRPVRDRLLPPSGSYRRDFTARELRAAGADDADAVRSAGVATLTFSGPRHALRYRLDWKGSTRPACGGSVGLAGRLTELVWNPAAPCTGHVWFAWRTDDAGDLVITSFDRHTEPAWLARAYAGRWKRVDCRPWLGWPASELAPRTAPPCPAVESEERPATWNPSGRLVYSPDRKRVAFPAAGLTSAGIWIVNADGSGAKSLTENPPGSCPCDSAPSFSPDGSRIAFVRSLSDGRAARFVITARGMRERRLTPWSRGQPPELDWSSVADR
jgi:TRAP-type C4-dicarboxylate transport system substrate-binding protein